MSQIVLLDGGLGQELRVRSSRPATPLWMAQTLLDEPNLVQQVQSDFLKSGAKVLTLAAYSSTLIRLERDGASGQFEALQKAAIEIAQKCVAEYPATIAGCLPPLVASYKAELAMDEDVCAAEYEQIIALQKQSVDLFLCETMSSIREINAAVKTAAKTGKPVWCAMSVSDVDGTLLRSGESLEAGVKAAQMHGAQAVLVNCSAPEAIDQSIPLLKQSGLPFGAYANGFVSIDALGAGGTVDVLKARQDLSPETYAEMAMNWVEKGATIVGGCCEVGPDHIKILAGRLVGAGHIITGDIQ